MTKIRAVTKIREAISNAIALIRGVDRKGYGRYNRDMTKTMELYILLKDKLGEQETKALIEAFDEVSEQAKREAATKADLENMKSALELKIEKSKTDSIKWMLAFWASQIGILIAAIAVMLKFFLK
ncbi:hypothetical protein [Candidatus Magnetominusculus dajiuhuensis]|uniref:hypothetical protein n=1 Tax=Candidatus Magnetominusculus dajiuhuensis TaxID=3137712 RepID=UPI003B428E85